MTFLISYSIRNSIHYVYWCELNIPSHWISLQLHLASVVMLKSLSSWWNSQSASHNHSQFYYPGPNEAVLTCLKDHKQHGTKVIYCGPNERPCLHFWRIINSTALRSFTLALMRLCSHVWRIINSTALRSFTLALMKGSGYMFEGS